MANEIDLYKDLSFIDNVLLRKDLDKPSRREWVRERVRVVNEIREKYSDLML